MANWTDEETFKVIELWSENTLQAMLEGSRSNRHVFAKISKGMEEGGFSKTADQCASKIKKLKFEYQKIKDANNRSGHGRKDWRFYDVMDEVLGHKPATQPPVVVESATVAEQVEVSENDYSNAAEESNESNSPGNSNLSRSGTPVNLDMSSRKGKKRKRTQDSIEQIGDLVGKIIKMQEDSEKNHLKLELKLLEMEERRHKESKEIMMRMMSLMCPQPIATSSQPNYGYHHPMYSSFTTEDGQ